jgi:hypothetical protein
MNGNITPDQLATSPLSLVSVLELLVHNPVIVYILLAPLALILLDIVTGVARALKSKTFSMSRISDFLSHDLLKYISCFCIVLLSWFAWGQYTATTLVTTLGMAVLAGSIVASILENIQALLAGSALATNPVVQTIDQDATWLVDNLGKVAATPPAQIPTTIQTPTSAQIQSAAETAIGQIMGQPSSAAPQQSQQPVQAAQKQFQTPGQTTLVAQTPADVTQQQTSIMPAVSNLFPGTNQPTFLFPSSSSSSGSAQQ